MSDGRGRTSRRSGMEALTTQLFLRRRDFLFFRVCLIGTGGERRLASDGYKSLIVRWEISWKVLAGAPAPIVGLFELRGGVLLNQSLSVLIVSLAGHINTSGPIVFNHMSPAQSISRGCGLLFGFESHI